MKLSTTMCSTPSPSQWASSTGSLTCSPTSGEWPPKLLQGCTLRWPAMATGKFSSQQKAWGDSQRFTSSLRDFPQLHHLYSGDNNGSVAVDRKEPNAWSVPGRWLTWMNAQQMAVFTLSEVKTSSRPCSQARACIFREGSGFVRRAAEWKPS